MDSEVLDPLTDSTNSPSVLWKAFDVLGSFSQTRRALTLSEIARRSGLPKSTVHRVLAMLVELKAIEREGSGYRVGLRMFSVGTCSVEVELRDVAMPHLQRLRRITGQTVHLAVLDGTDVVYLEKLIGASSSPTPAVVGGRLPAHATGVGKALLAFSQLPPKLAELVGRTTATVTEPDVLQEALRSIRRTGVATDREEALSGLACIAAPIVVAGRPVAAISVAFPSTAGSGELWVSTLRETTVAIERALTPRHAT